MVMHLGLLLAVAATVSAQYKAEPAGAPPSELAAPIAAAMQGAGYKVLAPDGKLWCEVWFVKQAPSGPNTAESDVVWKSAPHGAVIGAIRWPAAGYDRRGQNIKPGVYTLRFSIYPINGDHQGVAPQRDFLLLTPAAEDKTLDPVAKFDDLMNMARKTSGTPHPAVLMIWIADSDFKPGTMQQIGEQDWALHIAAGDIKIALNLVGKSE